MSAFKQMSNNFALHLGMFLGLQLTKIEPAPTDEEALACYDQIAGVSRTLSVIHAFCFSLLLIEQGVLIFNECLKRHAPLFSLPVVALAVYVCGLFTTNKFYQECHQTSIKNTAFVLWIKVEWAVFFANLCGVFIFLLLKQIVSRMRNGYKYRQSFGWQADDSGDTLSVYSLNSTQVQIAAVNLFVTIYVGWVQYSDVY